MDCTQKTASDSEAISSKNTILDTLKKRYAENPQNVNDLKVQNRTMYAQICRSEEKKYYLEKRYEEQLKIIDELKNRKRNTCFPQKSKISRNVPCCNPKIAVTKKYDHQIDRRSFGERRTIFDKRGASPCFPNIPPPSSTFSI